MSLSASTLRILLKHGVEADAIVEAAEAAEAEAAAEREARLAKRRESNRKRQRAWYDRHVRNNEDNGVSADDNQDNAVSRREDVRADDAKKVLEPIKNPSGITTSSTPTGSQVSSPSKPRRFDWPEDFRERFWDRYPRKTDRKKAMVALDRVWKADKVAFDVVMAGLDRMIASGLEVEFAPHPTTFLNNERWADEWPSRHGGGNGARAGPRRSQQGDFLEAATGYHRSLTEVSDDQGPFGGEAYGDPACARYENGHGYQGHDEPPGGRLRLAPPRHPGPPRPH